jgi:hypothetical protein
MPTPNELKTAINKRTVKSLGQKRAAVLSLEGKISPNTLTSVWGVKTRKARRASRKTRRNRHASRRSRRN